MTRLLFPEVYGQMTLVWAVLTGLQMFADTGIVPTIIRDERGDDPAFLNTAFTTNVIRGALLWVMSCLIAEPLAAFYHQPALAKILPVTGLTALIHGFVSTALYTRRRHMDFKRLAIVDLANEIVTFVVLVIWAYFYRNVWALVGGAVIAELEEGWYMLSNLVDCDPGEVAVGMAIEVAFRKMSDEITLPYFRRSNR